MENENDSKNNNFNFLRFIAAFSVIISHSFSLLKNNILDFLGVLGVTIFFIISGYLITQSWTNYPVVSKFIIKRLLRILPALMFCTIFTVFIIGPLTTNLPLIQYFHNVTTWTYFKNILLFPLQFFLPGVFEKNISPIIVNHSLWTLPVEFTAYVFVVFLGLCKLLTKKIVIVGLVALIAADMYLRSFTFYGTISFYDIGINGIVPYYLYFFIGSVIYLSRIKIRFNIVLFALSLLIFTIAFMQPLFLYGYYFAIPYIVFSIAFLHRKIPFFRKTDPSYGMYLFSMPIQQSFISFFPFINPLTLLTTSFIVTFPIAIVSWHLIESKFLFLKSKM